MTYEQWGAIKNCDIRYDSEFFYALKTTKTFCRLSCTSRTPNPRNVEIFDSTVAALAQGYRPCQRCRPDCAEWHGAKDELVNKAKAYLEKNYVNKLTLSEISQDLIVDPFHLHRTFKAITGQTILQYQHTIRIYKAMQLLIETDLSVDRISEALGYYDLYHFSKSFKKMVGLPPARYRTLNRSINPIVGPNVKTKKRRK